MVKNIQASATPLSLDSVRGIGHELKLHTREFAEASTSATGEAGLLEAARALALTVQSLARSPEQRRAVAEAAPGGVGLRA